MIQVTLLLYLQSNRVNYNILHISVGQYYNEMKRVVPTSNQLLKAGLSRKSTANYPQLNSPQLSNSRPHRIVHHSQLVYDVDDKKQNLCSICFRQGKLMNPCQCSLKYHQACLLQFIRKKVLNMKHAVDLSKIRCKNCNNQFKVRYTEHQKCSCQYYCQKIGRNWCEKTLAILLSIAFCNVVLSVLTILGALKFNQLNQVLKIIFFIVVGLQLASLIVLIIFFVYFFFKNLKVTELTLYKVYQWQQLMGSGQSISSDQMIYSQNFEVYIEEQ